MADNTQDLPDDIFCYIFSLLPVRDSVRARLSSFRWKNLPDIRSVLQFDGTNVLGKNNFRSGRFANRFVKAVDQFLDLWRGEKIRTLSICFCLGNKHALHIDKWIATAMKGEVEELDLNFSDLDRDLESYVFPSHLLSFETGCYLKRLCLDNCMLSLPFGCTSWLNHLTTLHLSRVPLHQSGVQCILSGGLNLRSLELSDCSLPSTLCIHLPLLKKLVIYDFLKEVEFNCPNLEVFEYFGRAKKMTFTYVPILREVKVLLGFRGGGCPLIFDDITRCARQLQTLSLWITSEVKPVLARITRCHLKQLDLLVVVPDGFDLLTITHLLHASPFLEILNLKMEYRSFRRQSPPSTYFDCPHFRLKEVKIERFNQRTMDLALYLLNNAVMLQKMIIQGLSRAKHDIITTLLQKKTSPIAEVIVL